MRDFAESVQRVRHNGGQTLLEELRAGVDEYKRLGEPPGPDGLSACRYRIISSNSSNAAHAASRDGAR